MNSLGAVLIFYGLSLKKNNFNSYIKTITIIKTFLNKYHKKLFFTNKKLKNKNGFAEEIYYINFVPT